MHVDPPPQSTEQLPVHVIWQVAPPEQSTLPLGPTVIVHDDVPLHLRLHDGPHSPVHSFMLAQSSEQLFSHVPAAIVHDSPDGQVQVEPEHFGAVPLLPQATRKTRTSQDMRMVRS